jgi:hypothetical protein
MFHKLLEEYVLNVSAVLFLCCSKCFDVTNYKCFYLDVTYVSHIYCKVYVLNVLFASDVCCI